MTTTTDFSTLREASISLSVAASGAVTVRIWARLGAAAVGSVARSFGFEPSRTSKATATKIARSLRANLANAPRFTIRDVSDALASGAVRPEREFFIFEAE